MSFSNSIFTFSSFLFKTRTGNTILSVFIFIFCLIMVEVATRIFLHYFYSSARSNQVMKLSYQPYVLWIQQNKREFFLDLQNKNYLPKGNKFRIIVIGGSTATQMPTEDLKEAFQPLVNKEVEVWNLGNGGYILNQALLMLSLHGIALEPDLIINLDGANDLTNFTKQMPAGISYHAKYVKMGVEEPIKKALFSILNQSQFFLALIKLKERSVEINAQSRYDDLEILFDQFLNTIDSIETIAKGSQAKYISVLQPYLYLRNSMTEKEQGLGQHKLYRREFLKQSFLDLESQLLNHQLDPQVGFIMSALKAFDNSNETCFIDWVHLTPTGNKILATYIAEQAKQRGLFEQ